MTDDTERYLTPPLSAKRLRVSPEKALNWIRKGELRAVNIGDGGHRPRYRVAPEDLEDFLKRREVQPPPPIQRRRRRRPPPEGGPIDPELGKELARRGKVKLCGGIVKLLSE
jgi:excisionase family DNA binding protein